MNHKGTVRLETDRLILRRITEADADAAFANWTGREAVTKFLTWQTHTNVEETTAIIRETVESYNKNDTYKWAIVPKELGEPIGMIYMVACYPDAERVQVGYCLGDRWWRGGYTSEAFAAVIEYLFAEVGVNRIEAMHDVANPNSGGVMRKCGLSYEGTLRGGARNNCGIVDVAIYSILKSEYAARKSDKKND